MIGYVPIRSGVITILLFSPGTASDFWPIDGTQNEWITSFEWRVSSTCRFTGRRRASV